MSDEPRRPLSDRAVDRLRRVGAAADAARPAVPPPYRLLEPIGHGGMGTVWLAHDAELDREVALKVVDAPGADAEDLARRLRQEARILARLEHPGIVPVHDVGTLPDGRAFYVMKRVRGRRLDQVVDGGAELNDLLRVFARVCEAVASAHANGVLHRDLKPENVMVGSFGEVLVMDWGAAKILGGASLPASSGSAVPASGTAHGTVIGTPGYMAPEQWRGDVAALGPAADVYALGALLFFLVRREHPPRLPFEGLEAAEPRRAPALHGRPAPKPLDAIVRKAMAERPEDRYASAEALAADVARYLGRLPVSAYPESPLAKALRLAEKYRAALYLVLAYVAMRILLIAFGGR